MKPNADNEMESRNLIAFDIKISPQQGKEFFKKVNCPMDRKQPFINGTLSLGYNLELNQPMDVLYNWMEQAEQ